jgi:hypothetical protein
VTIACGQVWCAKCVSSRGREIRVVRVTAIVKRHGNRYALLDNELGGRCSRIRFDILQRDYQRIGT